MQERHISVSLVSNPKNIYYFTGVLVDAALPQAFAMSESGKSLMISNQNPPAAAADRVDTYTAYALDRVFNRETMESEVDKLMRDWVAPQPGVAGLEFEFATFGISETLRTRNHLNLTPLVTELRRHKDADELECLRGVISLAEAGYAALKNRLAPGMTEFEAYVVMQEGMIRHAKTSVNLKGDFAAGVRGINEGGAPTSRRIASGDLYILDISPEYEGYACDLCRTFAVGKPAALQQKAWEHVREAHRIAERIMRPGARGSEVYREIRNHLEKFAPTKGSFNHHAGHGVGMDAWEIPWLTPGSPDVIREGDVVACEPGIYGENLQGGIRLERNYLVEKDAVRALDEFPLELV